MRKSKYGDSTCFRKHATGNLVGSDLLIYGGISTLRTEMFDDIRVLNLLEIQWRSIAVKGKSPGQLSGHSSVSVFSNYNKLKMQYNLSNVPGFVRKFSYKTKVYC